MKETLYNDDCLKILKSMSDKSIDLVITDPPYEISTKGGGSISKVKHLDSSLNKLSEDEIDKGYNFYEVHKELVRIMKNINIYIWCNKIQIPQLFDFYVTENRCKFDILCWHKTNALPTYKNKYLTDTEYCLYFRKGGYCDPSATEENERYENAKTFYISPLNQKDKKLYNHPTIKPLALIEKFIKNSSHKGDTILDCFMGSGTTGVACRKLERDFIGIEINKDYFETAKNRIKILDK